jgi:uncharacterized membrane protein YdbT with pleckstrin-like domain
MKKEQILLKVFRSRKSYFPYYLIILVIISLLGYFYYYKGGVESSVLIVSIVLGIVIIKFIEIDRIRDWWAISDTSFIESRSILNKNVREIDFNTIADIDLEQQWYKRIFGYGTVNIRKILNETSIVVRDINRPEKFINLLHDAIRKR